MDAPVIFETAWGWCTVHCSQDQVIRFRLPVPTLEDQFSAIKISGVSPRIFYDDECREPNDADIGQAGNNSGPTSILVRIV